MIVMLSFLELSIDDACPWSLRWEARDTSHDLSGQGRTYTDVCAAHTVLQATMHWEYWFSVAAVASW